MLNMSHVLAIGTNLDEIPDNPLITVNITNISRTSVYSEALELAQYGFCKNPTKGRNSLLDVIFGLVRDILDIVV